MSVEIFTSYAQADEPLRAELGAHLASLERDGLVTAWHDREILPGAESAAEIGTHLETAEVIVLLVSADFIASEDCWQTVTSKALERHEAGDAVVIPIIVRPCDWQKTPFAKLQSLPRDARPVTQWGNRDEAWLDVVRGIRKRVEPRVEELRGYVAWADERYRGLSLVGVGGGDVRLRLEEVYVPLSIARQAEPAELDPEPGKRLGARPEELSGDVELEEIFTAPGARRNVVILGDPGAGKTTVLRKLHQQTIAAPEKLGLARGTLPVFLPLRRLQAGDLDRRLPELLGGELHELSGGAVDAGLGRRLWRRGRLLLLLDGLDEIADDDLRARLCWYLERQLAEAAEGVRAVVSCRFTGYGGDVGLEEFLHLEVRPLGPDQCRELVRLWFREAPRALPDFPEGQARDAAERLVKALDGHDYGSQRLKVLVGSPLLLTLLCVVVLRGGEMPKHRVAFYGQCLRVLLSQWKRSKEKDWEPPLDVDTALAVLRSLAWDLHSRERRGDVSLPELLLHVEERLEQLGKEASAIRVLRWLHREAGVLAEFAPRHYGFLHLGVQEYLAASHIASLGEKLLDELCERCDDPWWQEVLLLTVGLPGRTVFAPLMQRLLDSPALVERADLLRACVDEAPEVDLAPFLAWLEPGREPMRQAAVLRLVRDRRDPQLEECVKRLAESAEGPVGALARQIADELARPRATAGPCDVFVVHHGDDHDAAVELAAHLDRRGLAVRTLAGTEGDDQIEQVLAGTRRVAVAVGRRAPWEETSLRSWLKLFGRRRCELVPVRLPESAASAEPPDDLHLTSWVELGEDMAGVEGLVEAPAVAVPVVAPGLAVPGKDFTEPLTEMKFLWIPGGRFRMGGEEYGDEKPVHWVRVSPYWLAETPVTNRQYAIFLEHTGHEEPKYWRDRRFSAPEQPVVAVTWHDARAFCRWLREETGVNVGLPTEAQWEFAARDEEGREYPWGDEKPDNSRACYATVKPAPVGSLAAGRGPFGTLDQAGNVWEWCQDAWEAKAYAKRGRKEPVDPCVEREGDPPRVLRGGAWDFPAGYLRAACRLGYAAASRSGYVGFRLAAAPASLGS